MKNFAFLILFIFSFSQAQTYSRFSPEQEEKTLVALADSLFHGSEEMILQYERETQLAERLKNALQSPLSFDYTFPELTKPAETPTSSIAVNYSDDKQLRVFAWRSPSFDSLHHFSTVIQAKAMNEKVIVSRRDPAKEYSFLEHLSRLKGTDRQLYLGIGRGQNFPEFVFQTIEIFEVNDSAIADVTDEILSSYASSIHILSSSTDAGVVQIIPGVRFDSENQDLYCPEMSGTEGTKKKDWTGRFIQLHFNQKKFEVLSRK